MTVYGDCDVYEIDNVAVSEWVIERLNEGDSRRLTAILSLAGGAVFEG